MMEIIASAGWVTAVIYAVIIILPLSGIARMTDTEILERFRTYQKFKDMGWTSDQIASEIGLKSGQALRTWLSKNRTTINLLVAQSMQEHLGKPAPRRDQQRPGPQRMQTVYRVIPAPILKRWILANLEKSTFAKRVAKRCLLPRSKKNASPRDEYLFEGMIYLMERCVAEMEAA